MNSLLGQFAARPAHWNFSRASVLLDGMSTLCCTFRIFKENLSDRSSFSVVAAAAAFSSFSSFFVTL